MKKEIRLSEAIGKTLDGFAFSLARRQAILTFTDGTFAVLGINHGYEAGDETLDESALDLFDFGHDKLVALGVVSEEEFDDMVKARNKALAELRAKRELEEYERLKRKFEN